MNYKGITVISLTDSLSAFIIRYRCIAQCSCDATEKARNASKYIATSAKVSRRNGNVKFKHIKEKRMLKV